MKDETKLRCSNCGNKLHGTRFKMINREKWIMENLCAFCTNEELEKIKSEQKVNK